MDGMGYDDFVISFGLQFAIETFILGVNGG